MCAKLFAGAMLFAFAGPALAASVTISVKETAGIRRFGYPVGVRVPFRQGALASSASARLVLNGGEVPAQYTGEGKWPDGSAQWLSVDFNATIGPNESQTYQLEYGPDVRARAVSKGLTVTEEGDAIQVGSVRFSKSGAPLVLSVKYHNEYLATDGTRFTVVDAAGKSYDLTSAEPVKVEILKRGPLSVMLRYTGRLGADVDYTITVEMPSSKSWVKVTASVDDPEKRLREIAYRTTLALGPFPWVWDFGTEHWTYGSLRNASDSVVLNETAARWQVSTGAIGKERAYENGGGQRVRWGHIQDSKETIAFGIGGDLVGKEVFALDGEGRASIRLIGAVPVTHHELTVYEHFVAPPVQIGAVTSPSSMLSPLVASCDAQ